MLPNVVWLVGLCAAMRLTLYVVFGGGLTACCLLSPNGGMIWARAQKSILSAANFEEKEFCMYSRSKSIFGHEGPSLTASVEVRYREARERSQTVGYTCSPSLISPTRTEMG
jgi:hypothetical protein